MEIDILFFFYVNYRFSGLKLFIGLFSSCFNDKLFFKLKVIANQALRIPSRPLKEKRY